MKNLIIAFLTLGVCTSSLAEASIVKGSQIWVDLASVMYDSEVQGKNCEIDAGATHDGKLSILYKIGGQFKTIVSILIEDSNVFMKKSQGNRFSYVKLGNGTYQNAPYIEIERLSNTLVTVRVKRVPNDRGAQCTFQTLE